MSHIDLAPATLRLAAIVAAIPDDALEAPTPCVDYDVGAVLAHIHGLTEAFTLAAEKATGDDGPPPPVSADDLPADWRPTIAGRLATMTDAWRDPAAWDGMTRVGGVDLPGAVCALVGLNEVVIHGWDLAAATGQAFELDDATADALLPMLAQFASPPDAPRGDGPFGPAVLVPADASRLDRVVALSGRDPQWAPTPPAS